MIWLVLKTVLSFVLPAVAGWSIVSTLWRDGSRVARGILGLGMGLGAGGTLWMLALLLSGSSRIALAFSESILFVLIVLLWRLRSRPSDRSDNAGAGSLSKPGVLATVGVVLALVGAAMSVLLLAYLGHHGGSDAISIWNNKARFVYLGARPLELLPDLTLADYPILHPSVIARGWQYVQRDTIAVPLVLAVFFLLGSIGLVFSLRSKCPGITPWIAGCVLAGTPFFLTHGMSQYADIGLCFFITAAVFLLALCDVETESTSRLALLAGLFAGFAACTKNEGTLVVVSIVAARLGVMVWNRAWGRDGIRLALFLVGLVPGALTLGIFRKVVAAPSELFANVTIHTIASRIVNWQRHSGVIEGFVRDIPHFGKWWINPLLLLVVFVVIRRLQKPTAEFTQAWRFPALFLLIMLSGYYCVYLFSPYDVVWHIQTSLTRLLVQLWPSALILWTLSVAERRL